MSITKKHFGTLSGGVEVYLFTLTNRDGLEVSIINYGGAITSLKIPDRNGALGNIVLGYETLEEYVRGAGYYGALIGRHANRIAGGRFSLNGVSYQLEQDDGPNHLHGGFLGFHKRVWDATEAGESSLRLEYFSPDDEAGYPGNLDVSATYSLSESNSLSIEYHAVSNADTIVNLTNHAYFNLRGAGTILDHELMLNADSFTPVSADLIPTGEVKSVAGTSMDFRSSRKIGSEISSSGGYDHNFVLRDYDGSLRSAARLSEASTGRVVEILTTQPGIQFYSGNFMEEKYTGLCLEPQHFPDSPNHPNFPSTVLRRGDEYTQQAVYRFSVS